MTKTVMPEPPPVPPVPTLIAAAGVTTATGTTARTVSTTTGNTGAGILEETTRAVASECGCSTSLFISALDNLESILAVAGILAAINMDDLRAGTCDFRTIAFV